jgi:hypothetical protein
MVDPVLEVLHIVVDLSARVGGIVELSNTEGIHDKRIGGAETSGRRGERSHDGMEGTGERGGQGQQSQSQRRPHQCPVPASLLAPPCTSFTSFISKLYLLL